MPQQHEQNICYTMKLAPRCLHCHTAKAWKRELAVQTDLQLCEAKVCSRPRFQGVGTYCSHHYLFSLKAHRHWAYHPRHAPEHWEIPESVINRSTDILQHFAMGKFQLPFSSLFGLFKAWRNRGTHAPNIFAIDTEFCYVGDGSPRIAVTEVAIVDMRTSRLVVHAILQPSRSTETLNKQKYLDLHSKTHYGELVSHVPAVFTVKEMVRQLKDCDMKRNDWIIEYSSYSHKSLDVRNLNRLLECHGYEAQTLVPAEKILPIVPAARTLFQTALGIDKCRLPYLFRILFPSDPLVDLNHSAAIDAMQLVRLVRFMTELFQPSDIRQLPPALFEGLRDLSEKDQARSKSNHTLDEYFSRTIDDSDVFEVSNVADSRLEGELIDITEDEMFYLEEEDLEELGGDIILDVTNENESESLDVDGKNAEQPEPSQNVQSLWQQKSITSYFVPVKGPAKLPEKFTGPSEASVSGRKKRQVEPKLSMLVKRRRAG